MFNEVNFKLGSQSSSSGYEKMSSNTDFIQKSQNIRNVEPQSLQEKVPFKVRNKVMSFNMEFFLPSENIKNKENRESMQCDKIKRHSANDCNIEISEAHQKSKNVQIQEKDNHLHGNLKKNIFLKS